MRGKVRIYFAYVVCNNEYIPLKQIIKILVFFLFELQIFINCLVNIEEMSVQGVSFLNLKILCSV